MSARQTAWQAFGIVAVLAAAFFSGVATEAGVVAAECARNGRATIAFKAFACEPEQPR